MHAVLYDLNCIKNTNIDEKKMKEVLESNNLKLHYYDGKNTKINKLKKEKVHIIFGNNIDSIKYFFKLEESEDNIVLYNFKFWNSLITFFEFNNINCNKLRNIEIANSIHEVDMILKSIDINKSSKKLSVLYDSNKDLENYKEINNKKSNIFLSKSTEKFMDDFFKNLEDKKENDSESD